MSDASLSDPNRASSPWLSLPNLLTISRIVLTVPVVYALLRPEKGWSVAALLIFGIAALTDSFDGYYARKLGGSRLGEMLDPVADKVFGVAVLVALTVSGRLPFWMLWALAIKEALLLLGGLILLRLGKPNISARRLGKYATIVLFIGFFDVIGGITGFGAAISGVGVLLSLAAGLDYAIVANNVLRTR